MYLLGEVRTYARLGMGTEVQWAIVYSLLLVAILVLSFSAARKFFDVKLKTILSHNTDALVYPALPVEENS